MTSHSRLEWDCSKSLVDELDLPIAIIQALKTAGMNSVYDLCARTLVDVKNMNGIGSFETVKNIRMALFRIGLDLRKVHEDPPGWPIFPSRRALHGLFDKLDLSPATRKALTVFLLGAIDPAELLTDIDPEDHHKVIRLLDLFQECGEAEGL